MVLWNSLELNISVATELCFSGFPAPGTCHTLSEPHSLEGQMVEQVEILKCLGTEIKHHLSSKQQADGVYKKTQHCMFLQRKLEHLNVRQDILTTVLTFNIASWYNFLTEKNKKNSQKSSSMQPKSPTPLKPISHTFRVTQ